MENKVKRFSQKARKLDFEQIDHRLACGWDVDIEGSGQRKRYLKSLTNEAAKKD